MTFFKIKDVNLRFKKVFLVVGVSEIQRDDNILTEIWKVYVCVCV